MEAITSKISLKRNWLRRGNLADFAFKGLTALFAAGILLLLAVMVYKMVLASQPSIKVFGFHFLVEKIWDPVFEKFGALTFIYGTLVSSFLALVLAVPVCLGVAIYLAELAPFWLRRPLSFLVELLAAIPSVIYGLWGIFVLAPWLRTHVQPFLGKYLGFLPFFQGPPLGVGMMAGGLILAIMITPTITAVSRDVMAAVPNTQREAALALGATQWETIRYAVIRYARSGIVGAVMLGLGRALGETMAVTMVIGNRPQIAASLFAPGYTMAAVIANEFTEATGDLYLAALIEIGLILLVITIILNIIARLLVYTVTQGPGGTARE